MRILAGAVLMALAMSLPAGATSFEPKTDNEIVALDLRSGELLWSHRPPKLSDAHFEIYSAGLVVYPHYAGNEKSDPMFLRVEDGKPATAFEVGSTPPLARSATFWPGRPIRLANGWRLTGFSPGNTKTLAFVDPDSGKEVWSLPTGGYPHLVRCWRNLVFYAFSYLSDEGVLYAYRAGEDEPIWTVDLNRIVTGRKKPLTRMILQVIDDVIYLEANEHVFAIAPETGTVEWHRNLSKDLGIPFEGGFFGGALNLAVFAKSDGVLVISFEKRVVALDLEKMRILWHLEPDTFPHCPFPVAHAGKLFLTSGKGRRLGHPAEKAETTESSEEDD